MFVPADNTVVARALTSPGWTQGLWCQCLLDTLLDPRNNDATPWQWLKALTRAYCGSDDALKAFPPTEVPDAAAPDMVIQVRLPCPPVWGELLEIAWGSTR